MESSIWLLLASMLSTLDISRAKDENGMEKELNVKFENAVFRFVLFGLDELVLISVFYRIPSSFECDIRPRSAESVRAIRETELA